MPEYVASDAICPVYSLHSLEKRDILATLIIVVQSYRMLPLNLPPQDLKIVTHDDGKEYVWDVVRKKWLVMTPEERVRQNFVHWLSKEREVPFTHMANEVTVNLNGLSRRCDTVVYDRALVPKMIIEYKAPSVNITRNVFDQISRYNLVLKVDFLVVSNGIKHYCVKMEYPEETYRFLPDIPKYSDL